MWERIALQLPSEYAPARMSSYYTPINPLLSKIVQKGQFSDIETEENIKKIDIVSKMLQKEDITIVVACNLLKGLTAQIKDYKGTIVNKVLEEAKQFCLDPSFKEDEEEKIF
ncbi:hypothetical protein AVEN_169710-1 [Araneus ventricosus]|uniref:Uncharacterized protein n=1 Tax=Araneus ventricosus TaxID=182803 RepID=A0A4Y2TDI6_ARAVE|nr:hypothetical protein AVEN_169710-1 [Araneus ventricosus]